MQENTHESNGEVIVDGVRLSSHVIQEFKRNGLDPTQYHAGILREVIAACADGKMIEDHNGGSLLDKLKLTADEKQNAEYGAGDEEDEDEHTHASKHSRRKKPLKSYSEMIHEEREALKWATHCHTS